MPCGLGKLFRSIRLVQPLVCHLLELGEVRGEQSVTQAAEIRVLGVVDLDVTPRVPVQGSRLTTM